MATKFLTNEQYLVTTNTCSQASPWGHMATEFYDKEAHAKLSASQFFQWTWDHDGKPTHVNRNAYNVPPVQPGECPSSDDGNVARISPSELEPNPDADLRWQL